MSESIGPEVSGEELGTPGTDGSSQGPADETGARTNTSVGSVGARRQKDKSFCLFSAKLMVPVRHFVGCVWLRRADRRGLRGPSQVRQGPVNGARTRPEQWSVRCGGLSDTPCPDPSRIRRFLRALGLQELGLVPTSGEHATSGCYRTKSS